MRAAAYIRVSTDRQEDSPDVQLDIIRRHCTRESYTLVAEYIDEDVSGKYPIVDRPSARRMLDDAKAKQFDVIVVKQLDRLGRNAADTISFPGKCKKLGVQLISAQETFADSPAGRIHFGMLALLAQYYREDIGQKTKEHNLWLAREGCWKGGVVPLGYKYDKVSRLLVPDAERSGDLITIFRVFIESSGNAELTARILQSLNIKSPRGSTWDSSTIRRLISNPIYRGYQLYNRIEHPFNIERIIPEDVIDSAMYLFEQRKGKRSPGATRVSRTYSHVLYCGVCGAAVWGAHTPNPKRNETASYRCCKYIKGRTCSARGISESRLDKMIPPAIKMILTTMRDKIGSANGRNKQPIKRISPSVSLARERERLLDVYLDGLIDKSTFEKRISEIESKEKVRQDTPKAPPRFDVNDISSIIDEFEDYWRTSMSTEEKRSILGMLTPRIIIHTGKEASAHIDSPYMSEPIVTYDVRR